MTYSKEAYKAHLKFKLSTDINWAVSGLLRIYHSQTVEERMNKKSIHANGIGFTKVDEQILTSIAKYVKANGIITSHQLEILFNKMPKYWAQLFELSDKEKLDKSLKLIGNEHILS